MSLSKKLKSNTYTVHNSVKLIRGGSAYFNLIEEMANSAVHSLWLQTYIFDEDETGLKVAASLIKAANRGVKVYLLVDGFASRQLSDVFKQKLTSAGVHFSFFKPFFKTKDFFIGRRLHHKVIVADAKKCMVGGINTSNRYNNIGNQPAWMDWALYAEGDVAKQLNNICVGLWNKSVFREKAETDIPDLIQLQKPSYEECLIKIVRNDWINRKTEITKSYYELFKSSHQKVILMTGYFWPSKHLLRKMAIAVKQGTTVNLILTSISDIPIAKAAERYTYRWLLRHGIKVYEYRNNILHGKIAVFDKSIVTCGSYNINNISAKASVELNLIVKNEQFAIEVDNTLQQIITTDCTEISKVDFENHLNIFNKLIQWFSYYIVHLIFYLFTFYFNQNKHKEF